MEVQSQNKSKSKGKINFAKLKMNVLSYVLGYLKFEEYSTILHLNQRFRTCISNHFVNLLISENERLEILKQSSEVSVISKVIKKIGLIITILSNMSFLFDKDDYNYFTKTIRADIGDVKKLFECDTELMKFQSQLNVIVTRQLSLFKLGMTHSKSFMKGILMFIANLIVTEYDTLFSKLDLSKKKLSEEGVILLSLLVKRGILNDLDLRGALISSDNLTKIFKAVEVCEGYFSLDLRGVKLSQAELLKTRSLCSSKYGYKNKILTSADTGSVLGNTKPTKLVKSTSNNTYKSEITQINPLVTASKKGKNKFIQFID